MRGRAIGSEAEGNVETGFAHRAVALVVVGAEANHMLRLALRVCHGRRDIADRDAIARSWGSGGLRSLLLSQLRMKPILFNQILLNQIMIGLIGLNREVADHLAVKTALVLQALGGWAVAKIVVTRKSGR